MKKINRKYIPKFNKKISARPRKHCTGELCGDPILVCSRCKHVFPEYLARCPECGSRDWQDISEVNPYNYLPMEQFLRLCGHILWLCSTAAALFLIWQTDTNDRMMNEIYILSAIVLCLGGILISVAYFGMSELTKRVERIQKRLRAFHENYRNKSVVRTFRK